MGQPLSSRLSLMEEELGLDCDLLQVSSGSQDPGLHDESHREPAQKDQESLQEKGDIPE